MSADSLARLVRPWPEALALALVVTFLATAALALVVRIALHSVDRPGARLRYGLAWGALWIGAGIGALSFAVALRPTAFAGTLPRPTAAVRTVTGAPGSEMAFALLRSVQAEIPPLVFGRLASALAWAWLAGAAILLTRVAGGWLVARGIRRRCVRVSDAGTTRAFEGLVRNLGIRDVELRESSEVDVPATFGGSSSLVVLPRGFVRDLAPEIFDALLAHELGHVAGGDGRAALAQAVLDALLFHCPGALWLSARAREAREHRCDDFAVQASGPVVYARALSALVDRRVWVGVGALGASGPRLSGRLRRLVEGEPTMKLNTAGSVALPLAAAVLAALSYEAGAATLRPPDGARRTPLRVPYGYSPQQPAAPVRLSNVKISRSASPFLFTGVRVRNATEENLRSVTLVAVLEGRGRAAAPARLFPTGPIEVSLAPGQAADLSLRLVTPAQIADAEKDFGRPAQSWIAVLRVTYDDGSAWRVLPRQGATKAVDALYLRQTAEVSRRLVAATAPPVPPGAWGLCMDDAGVETSPGGLVAIRGEPGHFAVCHPSGVFVESTPGADGASN